MISRRDFLRISGMASAAALMNWQFPGFVKRAQANEAGYDAIIIGAGLGGLSCAALMARYGMRPLVIDKRNVPGGYATSFHRGDDGEFTCEVSLHGLTGNPLGLALLADLFGSSAENIKEAVLAPHAYSWSSLYSDGFSLDIPQPEAGSTPAEILGSLGGMLVSMFPDEAEGIAGYMQCWGRLLEDIAKFYGPGGGLPKDISEFPEMYHTWASMLWKKKKEKTKTLTDLFKEYKIKNPQLQAILGQSWPYYGLPPSEMPAWLCLMYTGFYHVYGNYYIKGSSQTLSNALAQSIMLPRGTYDDGTPYSGGALLLNTEVTEILFDESLGRAVGVKTKQGKAFYANAVVSNSAVPQTMGLLPESAKKSPECSDYLDMVSSYKPSTSHVNVWLGLDLSEGDDGFLESYEKLGSNTLIYPGYKHDQAYTASMKCNPEKSGFAILAYDKVGTASPSGYASITLSMLSGYTPWEKFEAVYKNMHGGSETVTGNVTIDDYYAEKSRIAESLIALAEESVLPGLSGRIKMQEISSPLTNVRYTYNNCGAIYGYDQTEDNSGLTRLGNRTPVPGLYLAGAWSNPGGGFELVILSGKEAFKCIVEDWVSAA
ncbi:MAG: NAD(P)-binding protein [Candidatus Electrothrix scaldis]|nr:MAG: NAD(P)-binding protein [Candidatus Electrothrix sp. GW3-3]